MDSEPTASDARTPPPAYRLGRAGEAFVHAGPRLDPRIVSVSTEVRVHDIDLPPDSELFTEFGRILSDLNVRGAGVEAVSGGFSSLPYVRPAYGPDAAHPMHFSAEMSADCPVEVRAGSATVGFRDSLEPFAHIHASWTDRFGRHRGGHLLPGATVGAEGLRLRVFAYSDVELLSATDEETGLPTFAPRPRALTRNARTRTDFADSLEPTHETERRDPVSSDGLRRAVVSRVRPGQLIDEAVLDVCRAAGFSRAEVRASLGSTVGAVFEDVDARGDRDSEIIVDWPAAEYTLLRGTVDDIPGEPRVELVAEAVDIHGQVLAGRVRNGKNPVAVTFELLLVEL